MYTFNMPSKGVPVDASPLYQHEVFRCASLAQSHAYLRTILAEHHLRPAGGDVDSALYMADMGHMKLLVLRYGPEVEVVPQPFEGFTLVQVPLRGETEIHCDGSCIHLVPGQSALISPRRRLRLVWSRDCEQLIVRMPNGLVQTAVQTSESWRRISRFKADFFAPITLITGASGTRWNLLIESLIYLAAHRKDRGLESHPAWITHSELGAAVFLLTLQDAFADFDASVELRATHPANSRPTTGRGNPLVAAEQYARSRLHAPIALEDLARAACVSARSLQVHCKRRHGVSPMRWLRDLRLDVAREELQRSRNIPVIDVAAICGFGHLGRFAAYYRNRFGELPRDTQVI